MSASREDELALRLRGRMARTIRERALWSDGAKVLAAVSGGADSVALMHLLVELGVPLVVATVDHGLRAESAREAVEVVERAERLGVRCEHLSLQGLQGANIQARAREARYAALERCRAHVGAEVVCTGHTRDDQAETVLDRITRGAGLRGLGAIDPCRSDRVTRPLIDLRRAELRGYLGEKGEGWVEDPSNQNTRFKRVRLRALLSTLEGEDPALVDHLASLADEARDAARALRPASTSAELSVLRGFEPAVRREAIRAWAQDQGRQAGRKHVEQLMELVKRGKGEVLLGRGDAVRVEHDRLVLERGRRGRSG